ncbi:MAG: threonine/serine exporter family protein [Lachnotalea sp.]
MFLKIIAAGLAALSFSILFSTPRKEYLFCGLTGSIGWFCYLMTYELLSSVVLATFGGTIVVTFVSRFFAVNRRVPVTVFLIAGIFPLVPGTGIYFTTYYIFIDQLSLAGDYGRESMGIALAIAFGIMIIFLIPQKWFHYKSKNRKFDNLIKKWY